MFNKILNVFLIFLSCISVFLTGLYIYTIVSSDDIYTGSVSTYATDVTDPVTGEKFSPFTINYYSNSNGSGKSVIEFRINCFSDQNKTVIYSRGFQLIDDVLYYYDGFNGESWKSMHIYDETNSSGQEKPFFYITVNDKLAAIRLDGKYDYTVYSTDTGKIARTLFFLGFNLFYEGTNFQKAETMTHYYTFKELLQNMALMIQSASYGTGDFTMPLVDLGDFLHIYEVYDDGTVSDKAIGDGGLINSYFAMDIHYDKRGMTYADQSIFKSVALDSNFNISGIDFNVNYWKTNQVFEITESDFEERYSTVDGGYYYYLPSKFISELKNFANLEINIVFDISKFKNKNVLGFDNYALYGIKVNSLTISSSSNRSFSLLVGSLKDTGLSAKSIKTNNVTLNNISSGVEL